MDTVKTHGEKMVIFCELVIFVISTLRTVVKESVTFRHRSSSDPDALTLPITTGAPPEIGPTGFTGMGCHWPSLSTSVPTPTSPVKMLVHQGGIYARGYWTL